MKRVAERSITIFLIAWLTLAPILPAVACAPIFPVAIICNTSHPDLPLKKLAAGNLGVIQPAWAKSYLCVVYRYLTDNPLDSAEQTSILGLWHRRLKDTIAWSGDDSIDQVDEYLKLRAKALGINDRSSPNQYSPFDEYSSRQTIGSDAFLVATRTLQDRIKRYGLKSLAVREWIKGQDAVFGIGADGKGKIPGLLGANFDALSRYDRAYQIAAATFYTKDYAKAVQLFEKIAADAQSPWQTLASYLVARCRMNEALPDSKKDSRDQVLTYLQSLLKDEKNRSIREDLMDLWCPLKYSQMSRTDLLDYLVKSVTSKHCQRFGGDVGDLTYTMDEAPASGGNGDQSQDAGKIQEETLLLAKHDLTDWLTTIQQADVDFEYYNDDEKKQFTEGRKRSAVHAIEQWRKTHSLHWLVAALCSNGLRSPEQQDLLEATTKVPASSPAYLTASFFLIDALIGQGKPVESRQRIVAILNRKDLPPSTVNLFRAQFLAVAPTVEQYLSHAFATPPETSSNSLLMPKNFLNVESKPLYWSETPVADLAIANDLNCNLPLSLWLQLAKDKSLDSRLRRRIVRSAWLRAQLLERPEAAAELSGDFAGGYPNLSGQIQKYSQAAEPASKRFALACLILKNFGMSPYLEAGVERHGEAIDSFDEYNDNFWLPFALNEKSENKGTDTTYYLGVQASSSNPLMLRMQSYYKPGINRLLSKQQQATAGNERAQILKNHPSRFLGDAVLAWQKSHADDPLVPEMLYRIVKLPKWSQRTPLGTEYSRKAFSLLHSRYAKSSWSKKAVSWY